MVCSSNQRLWTRFTRMSNELLGDQIKVTDVHRNAEDLSMMSMPSNIEEPYITVGF